jgi:thiamine pyrophosphate-dependent acetolactate synthase large subunit-like protein
LNLLWREAEDATRAADSIVVIGYSFPETDLQSSNLFCNAFLRRQTMPKVHIVDPAPERVTGKISKLVRHSVGSLDSTRNTLL